MADQGATAEPASADVIVLGLGPGGEDLAGRLARAGLDVLAVDRRLVGGECPYYGCVPSKMMIRAAGLLAEARRIPGMAGSVDVTPDYAPVAARIRAEATDDWDDTVAVDRLRGTGARFLRGDGRVTGPGRVEVAGHTYTARRGLVIATGTEPAVPPVPGLAGTPFWTNREAVEATAAPESLIVLGGGSIGCELAQMFARFGTRVEVVEATARLLPAEEPESGELLADAMRRDGVTVHVGTSAAEVGHDGAGFTLRLDAGDAGGQGRQLRAERLLVATGRRTGLAELGVAALGLDPQARALEVDERLRVVGTDGVWAVGDVTGRGAFTHVAMYQSPIAARSILGQDGPAASYHALPRVTFTDPEIGAVGLTERDARDRGFTVSVGQSPVPSSARGWIHKVGNEGFIKIIRDDESGQILGATSAGPAGGEVLGALAVAVHARVPVDTLRQMIWAYPTFHRAIESALSELD